MAKYIPPTRHRVRRNTAGEINRRIDRQIERNILFFAEHPDQIGDRLQELDREWDIERMIQTNAATLALLGAMSSVRGSRMPLVIPLLVTGFLLQHAIQGWCPPVPILRRLGFRTADEINRERYALKALRGDFGKVGGTAKPATSAKAAIKAVEGEARAV